MDIEKKGKLKLRSMSSTTKGKQVRCPRITSAHGVQNKDEKKSKSDLLNVGYNTHVVSFNFPYVLE